MFFKMISPTIFHTFWLDILPKIADKYRPFNSHQSSAQVQSRHGHPRQPHARLGRLARRKRGPFWAGLGALGWSAWCFTPGYVGCNSTLLNKISRALAQLCGEPSCCDYWDELLSREIDLALLHGLRIPLRNLDWIDVSNPVKIQVHRTNPRLKSERLKNPL